MTLALAFALLAPNASAQLRIATYNTANGANRSTPRSGMATILEAIGQDDSTGFSKSIDVLALQEQASASSTTQQIVNLLNGIYSEGTYARSTINTGPSYSDIRQTVIYNTQTVSLVNEFSYGSTSSSGAARQAGVYTLRPVGYGSDADFTLFNSHYKASSGSSNQNRRNVEAQSVRNYLASHDVPLAIQVGDLNLYSGYEPAFQTLTASGQGQFNDPLANLPGYSLDHNSNFYQAQRSQSPVSTQRFSGQVTGGLDNRFDYQLISNELNDGQGLSIIDGTYRVFGNNGSVPFNGEIDQASNSWSPAGLTMPASQVLSALATTSDHLPVVADYRLPAKMSADLSLDLPAPVVIQGANIQAQLTVGNIAPVAVAQGADTLAYEAQLQGFVQTNQNGQDIFAGETQTTPLTVDTSQIGVMQPSAQVVATSQQAGNKNINAVLNLAVLGHANASFDENENVDTKTLDAGLLMQGMVHQTTLDLFNLDSGNLQAGLQWLTGSQNSGQNTGGFLSIPTVPTAAGGVDQAELAFVAEHVGHDVLSFTLHNQDQDLPGATAGQPLTIDVVANIVAYGDTNASGDLSSADIDTLQAAVFNQDPSGFYDLTHDGQLNDDDVTTLITNILGTQYGDADLDGDVDLDDLTILGTFYGQTETGWAQGDFDGSGLVDLDDLTILGTFYGHAAETETGSFASDLANIGMVVPEPTTPLMLVLLSGFAAQRRRSA